MARNCTRDEGGPFEFGDQEPISSHRKLLRAQEVRALLTARKLLQSKNHDVEMSLRGVLRGFGLKVGPTTPRTFANRIRELVAAKTEVWAWVLADKAASPEVKEAMRLAGVRVFGPSGTFEQDDMDNWQGCTQSGRRVVARCYHLSYEMGLGHERFDEGLGALASDYRYSESNHRGFYRRWAELMTNG